MRKDGKFVLKRVEMTALSGQAPDESGKISNLLSLVLLV
jgi:hypothetical protein